MLEFLSSFLVVVLAEMGDKTQLLAIAFAMRYPWKTVFLGILIATVFNHFIAIEAGIYLNHLINPDLVHLFVGIFFIVFGFWLLVDDKLEDGIKVIKNPLITVITIFFLAEMGDKTQLATMVLSAQIGNHMPIILLGSTFGMLVADGLGIVFGKKLHQYLPDKIIKRASCILFIVSGIAILIN